LVDVAGSINAIKSLGSNFVAYKDKGMFLGQYIGSPLVWQWTQVPSEVGCSSQEAIANVSGIGHIFIGLDNIYLYNGSALPLAIGDGMKDWFFSDLNQAYRTNIRSTVDKVSGNVWFFYPRKDSVNGALNAAIIFNYKSQKWGVWSGSVECPVEYLIGATSYDAATGTFDAQTLSYDSPLWTNTTAFTSIIDTTHSLKTLTGDAGTTNITFGDFGHDALYSTLTRARVRFIKSPTSATMTNQFKKNEGEDLTIGTTSTMFDGKFDFLRSSRWHRVTLQTVGNMEFNGIDYQLEQDGSR